MYRSFSRYLLLIGFLLVEWHASGWQDHQLSVAGRLRNADARQRSNGRQRLCTIYLHIAGMTTDLQGTACFAPASNPCRPFSAFLVASSAQQLENVSGSLQAIPMGQSFQPIAMRVTDSSIPPNPVTGASVVLQSTLFLPTATEPPESNGETNSSNHAMKVLLGSSQTTSISDSNGLVRFLPTTAGILRPLQLEILANAGVTAHLQFELEVLPPLAPTGPDDNTTSNATSTFHRIPKGPPVTGRSHFTGYGLAGKIPRATPANDATSSSTDPPSR